MQELFGLMPDGGPVTGLLEPAHQLQRLLPAAKFVAPLLELQFSWPDSAAAGSVTPSTRVYRRARHKMPRSR